MTKWQHFLHSLGRHDWHKTKDFVQQVTRQPCGPHDPRPSTEAVNMVSAVCCQCGLEKTVRWITWIGL